MVDFLWFDPIWITMNKCWHWSKREISEKIKVRGKEVISDGYTEGEPFRVLFHISISELSEKVLPTLNSIDVLSMLSLLFMIIKPLLVVVVFENGNKTNQNMVEMDKCAEYEYSTVVANHFTVCQKPWSCIYQLEKPLCIEFNKRWWMRSRRVERMLHLEPREECPRIDGQMQYVSIDYLSSEALETFSPI